MEERTIPWDQMLHPDLEAMMKRDAFLSDENGMKLREMIDEIRLMEETLEYVQNRNGGEANGHG